VLVAASGELDGMEEGGGEPLESSGVEAGIEEI
jgi:hypothetical protein